EAHRALVPSSKSHDGRLFTLSQGQLEVKFPEGFGIPVLSTEALPLTTQVLNLNDPKADLEVRHRVTFDVVPYRFAKQPMNPLYQGGVFGLKTLSDHEMAYDLPE